MSWHFTNRGLENIWLGQKRLVATNVAQLSRGKIISKGTKIQKRAKDDAVMKNVHGFMIPGSGFIIPRKATSTNLQGLEYTILEVTSYQNDQICDCFQAIFGMNRNFLDMNRNSSALDVRLSIEITYHRRAD